MTRLRLFALLLFALALPAFAQERILSYDSTVAVNADGSMDVTETIKVHAEGTDIRRGIYRELPSSRKNPVQIESLTMDGQSHPYFTERVDKNLRINF